MVRMSPRKRGKTWQMRLSSPKGHFFSLIGNKKGHIFLYSLQMHLTQTLAFFSLIRVLRDRGAILKIWGLT
jgi:hypothetical protein